MPQLDFTTYASQIFWLAVSFLTLYLIMARSTLPTIREVLQNRQTRIAEDIKKAEKLKTEAESAEADFTSVIISARSNASSILGKARERAARESDERHAKLDETFARQAKEADHRIEVLVNEAKKELTPVTVEASILMLKKLAGIKADKKKVENLVAKYNEK